MSYLSTPESSPASAPAARKQVTLPRLTEMHAKGEKIVVLTCYDASFAALQDRAGVDIILIGDSLGNVIQGETSTLPVTLEEMVYHTRCVVRGLRNAGGTAWVMGDLPYGSYHESHAQAYASAAALMRAGAQMVKIEAARDKNQWMIDTVRFLSERGIPVCAHFGLTPQSVHQLGGYRVQGKSEAGAALLRADALAAQEAGAAMLLFEMVPAAVAAAITQEVKIPVIGIGAGAGCSGQVLVIYDMLGVFPGKQARFVKNFMIGAPSIEAAVRTYVEAVKSATFPQAEHAFS
jgi:3-methyl-2-oxobutanoate hydroxymethyltransferase